MCIVILFEGADVLCEDELLERIEDPPQLPSGKQNSSFPAYPEWQGTLPQPEDIMSQHPFFSDDILDVLVDQSNLRVCHTDESQQATKPHCQCKGAVGAVLSGALMEILYTIVS